MPVKYCQNRPKIPTDCYKYYLNDFMIHIIGTIYKPKEEEGVRRESRTNLI